MPGDVVKIHRAYALPVILMELTRVNLHCHSVHSDGDLTPREVAEHLAAAGVVAAALTDHNTVDGLEEFQQALARYEIGYVPGVEITAFLRNREIHLLAYGIDPTHEELLGLLASLRQTVALDIQSVAGSIRTKGSSAPNGGGTPTQGRIDIADAITLIHRAGGKAFLAHPLLIETDFGQLESLLEHLQKLGLDGIECLYAQFNGEESLRLCDMARRFGLLVSAGTDLHDRKTSTLSAGIEMPSELWKSLRDVVCRGNRLSPSPSITQIMRPHSRVKWRNIIFRFAFPTLLAMLLFIGAIFVIILPSFEHSLLERKREMIRELTNSAWSILSSYERDEHAGRLSRKQAQTLAIARIEALRYGHNRKDYFWLQDMQPRIIMHPYRKDLNSKDVSAFRDPRGVAIFKEFVRVVRQNKEGYAQYVWQWNDDPNRLVPKESYVKGFEPWGWIIGTGIYIEDVSREIKRIERNLVQTALLISVVVVLLLLYVMFESLRLERERADTEESLRQSTERYRSLVEAATEGTLLVVEGRCRYANRTFLDMLGTTLRDLEMLDLTDIFPIDDDNAQAWTRLNELLQGEDLKGGFDAVIQRRDGGKLECMVISSRIAFAEQKGFILLARTVSPEADTDTERAQHWQHLHHVVDEMPMGIFRARATARGTLVALNPAAKALLSSVDTTDGATLSLVDVFTSQSLYDEFFDDLQKNSTAERNLHRIHRDSNNQVLAIVATLVRDEHGTPRYVDGVIENVSARERHIAELESVLERLQTSLLFLHEPVSHVGRSAAFCSLETPIHAAAKIMTEHGSSAILVQSDTGVIVGIVTDSDIRRRVLAANMNDGEPVHRIMSSPLTSIREHANIYEALLLMEQHQIQHLAVEDDTGRVIGVIRNQELMQFRSYGPIFLTREVERAATPEDVVRACQRVSGLARALLDCGAYPHLVTHMISAVCNSATIRLIELAEKELGPSPVQYVFLSLGSQGREEMTLASDQDNAILYQDPADADTGTRAEGYLLKLGHFVCGWLDRAGYPLCKGEILAQNKKWCQPLSIWKRYFNEWIESAEPQQLLEFTIFFDFRPVYGQAELARELRQHLSARLHERPAFYPHLAQNALLFKPPTRLFGRFLGGTGEHAGQLDLKEATMPIVSFARLYALRQDLDVTQTLERLTELAEAEVLSSSSCQETSEAYEFLMRLRLQQQATTSLTSHDVGNSITPRRLRQVDQTLLNQAFAQITAIQQRMSHDFLGGHSQL